jgi:hypothetical protein
MNETELVLYCDFHGHSRKQNVFMYGCENKHLPNERLKERIFPAMLSKNDPSKVCIEFLNINLYTCTSFSSHIVHVNSKFKKRKKVQDESSCGLWVL